MNNLRKKRYYCTYVKLLEDKTFKVFVTVIAAESEEQVFNLLCSKFNIPKKYIPSNHFGEYKEEGIVKIRLSDTNVYEGESVHNNFRSNS